MTTHDFANYRNLARRAENSGHAADELRLLRKCLEVAPHGEPISKATLAAVEARINVLETANALAEFAKFVRYGG